MSTPTFDNTFQFDNSNWDSTSGSSGGSGGPTFDGGFTWDVSNWDGGSIPPITAATAPLVSDPRRTYRIVGEEERRVEFLKDPDSRVDYTFDWTAWLAPTGDTIASGIIGTPGDLVVTGLVPTATTVTLWAEGGSSSPRRCPVVCRILTAQGRVVDRTINLRIRDL